MISDQDLHFHFRGQSSISGQELGSHKLSNEARKKKKKNARLLDWKKLNFNVKVIDERLELYIKSSRTEWGGGQNNAIPPRISTKHVNKLNRM